MKNINLKSLTLALFVFGNFFFSYSTPIKLNDAIQSKKAEVLIRGNSSSTHYLEPIILEAQNKSNNIISIAIESGDEFIPTDDAKQNIVVTAPELLVLKPNEKKSIKIKGMCLERSDGAGNDQTIYTFQAAENDTLKKLADFISTKKYQTSAAQYAVWSLMNHDDLNSIYSSDSTEENDLKKFMALLTGKTFVVQAKNYRNNYYAPPREKVGGNFEYSFAQPEDIQIAMFDKNGILVRELFNQKKVPAGNHKLNFEYDSSVYADDVYYFKLIVGNDVLVNRKWDATAMRDSFKKKVQDKINGEQ